MADSRTNSFWLENLLNEMTPTKEDILNYRRREAELNDLLKR